MTNWDLTGAYDPPLLVDWPEPADDPDTEPDEGWARDDSDPGRHPEP